MELGRRAGSACSSSTAWMPASFLFFFPANLAIQHAATATLLKMLSVLSSTNLIKHIRRIDQPFNSSLLRRATRSSSSTTAVRHPSATLRSANFLDSPGARVIDPIPVCKPIYLYCGSKPLRSATRV